MARRWEPGLVDVVFGVVLALVLVGGRQAMLNDPGTLWHLRLGRDVLSTGHVPRVDTLTYTRESAEWVDQSWLFDVGLALAVDHGGWSLAVALAALGLATIYAGLASSLARDGHSPVAVLVVSVVAAGVGAIHFLVRPHLLTLGFFLMTLRLCRAQHERGGCRVFWVVPLMVIWATCMAGSSPGPSWC